MQRDIHHFYSIGISYKKTDAHLRGQFAISSEKYGLLLAAAARVGLNELFVISTCNRTEIYGFDSSPDRLMTLLCDQTAGSLELFRDIAYVYQGTEAITHLFHVAAGLDSQILGDYEIVGQLKQAVKFSREHGFLGTYLERMISCVLQASKQVKNETALSGGTVSVSFAAIQYIRESVVALADKQLLLIGTGKMGRNTCRNLVDYLPALPITLINRTHEKAVVLAKEMNVKAIAADQLETAVAAADIILVATNAEKPVILRHQLEGQSEKVIIDLSVPYNVEESVQELSNITLINVDELSRIKDATLEKRRAEVPKVKAIIAAYIEEYTEWHEMRRHVPLFRAVKNTLQALHTSDLYNAYTSRTSHSQQAAVAPDKIQKVINGMAVKMRHQNRQGCHYLEAIHEYIATATN